MMAAERVCGDPHAKMHLARLLDGIVEVPDGFDVPVNGLSADSRAVEPGQLFLGRRGATTDGARYFDAAVASGAVALIREGEPACRRRADGVVEVCVPDVVVCTGLLADRFYRHPSRDLSIVGVTGTNGKTSVTHFVAQAIHKAIHESDADASAVQDGQACGVIGTLGYGVYGDLRPSLLTTPDAIAVHAQLAQLRDSGVEKVVMEVSSHALDQGRVEGVDFDGAVFTNLTRDHLDYHGDMQAYRDAKAKLFDGAALRYAVINEDDVYGAWLLEARRAGVRTVAYGIDSDDRAAPATPEAEWLRAGVIDSSNAGTALSVRGSFGEGRIATALLGRFNAYNLLAALAVLMCMGWKLPAALGRLADAQAPAGRMQRFGGGPHQPLVVVDYSHTPDSLARALESLREQCNGKLWCVFGAGGDRDRGKRPMMAAAAAAHADTVVLTDDNPRGEDGDGIIDDLRGGIPRDFRLLIERDRAAAIALALAGASPGDIVLVAGKGHESYQEIRGQRLPFSDAAAVRAALEAMRT
jgi:UDP-N-acetylmuramoyl-L-alanyl-D-glutamate--2,6-diaminopimelate ligase